MFDLRIDPQRLGVCVKQAVAEWLRRKGRSDKATVTVDGCDVKVELTETSSAGSLVPVARFADGFAPVQRVIAGANADVTDDPFDQELFDLIQERMACADDLVVGEADDLA